MIDSAWRRVTDDGQIPAPGLTVTRLRILGGRRAAVAVGVAAISMLAAACGGGSAPGVASLGPTTSTTAAPAPAPASGSTGNLSVQLRYARCMQVHGVPDFPEPGGSASSDKAAMEKIDPSSPAYRAAAKACNADLPKGRPASPAEQAKVQAEALKFARCVQTHGMANWPDPMSGGYMVAPVGAAAHAPAYLKAAKACDGLLPKG